MAEKGRLFTGARASFLVNGKKVGYASNVSASEMIDYQDIEVLDNIEVEEQVAIAYRVTLSARRFRIVGETMKSLGFMPETGKNTEEHLTNILNSGDLNAAVFDSRTGKNIMTFQQVKVASLNWTIDARGVVGEDVEFRAIRIKDESEVV